MILETFPFLWHFRGPCIAAAILASQPCFRSLRICALSWDFFPCPFDCSMFTLRVSTLELVDFLFHCLFAPYVPQVLMCASRCIP